MAEEEKMPPISVELQNMRTRHLHAMQDFQTRHPDMSVKMYTHDELGKVHVISEGKLSVSAALQKAFLSFQKTHGLQAKGNIGRMDCDAIVRDFIKFSQTRPEFEGYACRGLWMENPIPDDFVDTRFFREIGFSHHALCLISPASSENPSPTIFVDLTAAYNVDAGQDELHVLAIAAHDQLSAFTIFSEVTDMFPALHVFRT